MGGWVYLIHTPNVIKLMNKEDIIIKRALAHYFEVDRGPAVCGWHLKKEKSPSFHMRFMGNFINSEDTTRSGVYGRGH